MPSLNYTIAGTLILHSTIFRSKGYWFRLLWNLCGYPKAPSTPLLISAFFFTSSVSCEKGFQENPSEPYHTRAYGLLNRCPTRIYRLMITCIRLGAFPLLRDTFFLSVTQEGNRTHHFNPPLGWAPRLFRAINPQRCRWSNQTHYLFLF